MEADLAAVGVALAALDDAGEYFTETDLPFTVDRVVRAGPSDAFRKAIRPQSVDLDDDRP